MAANGMSIRRHGVQGNQKVFRVQVPPHLFTDPEPTVVKLEKSTRLSVQDDYEVFEVEVPGDLFVHQEPIVIVFEESTNAGGKVTMTLENRGNFKHLTVIGLHSVNGCITIFAESLILIKHRVTPFFLC